MAVTNHFVTELLWEEAADEFAGTEIKLHFCHEMVPDSRRIYYRYNYFKYTLK